MTGIWRYQDLTRVSMSDGRLSLPMVMGDYQAEQFAQVKYYAELVHRKDGTWFLMRPMCRRWIPTTSSVDLGVENLATDSDGEIHSGDDVAGARQAPDAQAGASVGG